MSELVIVNGASNISKRVVQMLTKSKGYNKVRLLDFRPYRQSVYAFQREMLAQGVTVDKRLTNNGQSLGLALEGATDVVYFTHEYTNMVSCKNNFLIGTAKLAAQQKIKNVIAMCPVEHDLAYSEDDKNWVQKRQEAEQEALSANKNLTILNTDLVFSEGPSHLLHFAAQSIAKGSIPVSFLGQAAFKPIHSDDLARAIAHV